ncbi:MAG: hypothetical protein LR015_10015 [Verrucomicrobia bacterium]|nr:hypothetical protein [Verrucomicrobiota bacterium]
MPYLVSIDHGSTAIRAVAFDEEGRLVGLAQKDIRSWHPEPGFSEYAPAELLASTVHVSEQLMFNLGISASEVSGLGISNQRDTVIAWNRLTGEAVGTAMAGDDWRALDICRKLQKQGFADTILDKTGQPLAPYFAAPKITWLLDHLPEARRMAVRGELAFGTIESWLVWQLTGGSTHVMDATNAARTLLYNMRLGKWDGDLLKLWGIPESVLPAIVDNSCRLGTIQQTGHPLAGVPILAIATDEAAALFGQGCLTPGDRQVSLGAYCNLVQLSGPTLLDSSSLGVAQTVAWQLAGVRTFALEEQVDLGGTMLELLHENWGLIDHISQVEEATSALPYNQNLWLIPPRGLPPAAKAQVPVLALC